MNTREEKLKARVAAVNRANAYAAVLYAAMIEKFTPLMGQKILKVDGSLLAKHEIVFPPFPRQDIRDSRETNWRLRNSWQQLRGDCHQCQKPRGFLALRHG